MTWIVKTFSIFNHAIFLYVWKGISREKKYCSFLEFKICLQLCSPISNATPGISKLWTLGQNWPSVNKFLLEHSHVHLFLYGLCLLSCYGSRVEYLREKSYNLQSLKYWYLAFYRSLPIPVLYHLNMPYTFLKFLLLLLFNVYSFFCLM